MASTALPAFYGVILRERASGPDIALAQEWLNAARTRYPAMPMLRVDGRFGPDTQASVRAYQRATGLKVDGTVGAGTWDSLYETHAALYGAGEIWNGITVREGDRGAVVKSAQLELRKLVPWLAADGHYGPDTRDAVFAYQVVHHLKPDGVLGKDTWEHLFGRAR